MIAAFADLVGLARSKLTRSKTGLADTLILVLEAWSE